VSGVRGQVGQSEIKVRVRFDGFDKLTAGGLAAGAFGEVNILIR
jgi:hypothetical protein